MLEPRMISPILDGFHFQQVISSREGILCCLMTEAQSANPFVLKIVSVPASSTRMDAMLMTGAFSSRSEANSYFKEQARAILNEAKALRHLTTLGGFTDFDCVQVVPSADGNGFEIYILTPYRQSLTQLLQKEDLTHLEILNMGLDLCAALTNCRHAGYFYANLKPSNVFKIGQHYRIGDLGFIPLSQLNRTPLAENLQSSHTPPELLGSNRPIHDTADVYALGLLLYQAYNGGRLPGKEDIIGLLYAPPAYADYEMAQIILRACAPDPAIRWSSPEQMGLALTRYLQRNGMKNTPIVPPSLRELASGNSSQVEEFLPDYPEDVMELQSENAPPSEVRPVRRRKAVPSKRWSKGKLIVAILAVVLILELIIGICLVSRSRKEKSGDDSAAFPIHRSAAQLSPCSVLHNESILSAWADGPTGDFL